MPKPLKRAVFNRKNNAEYCATCGVYLRVEDGLSRRHGLRTDHLVAANHQISREESSFSIIRIFISVFKNTLPAWSPDPSRREPWSRPPGQPENHEQPIRAVPGIKTGAAARYPRWRGSAW